MGAFRRKVVYIYDFWKDSYYDKYPSSSSTHLKGGDINGQRIQTGTTENFYLEATINNPDGIAYTLEFVDDFLYIVKNNGEYRQLEAGEYEMKQVVIPGTSSMKNLNGVSIKANQYKALVYAVTNGEHINENSKVLVSERFLITQSQTINLPDNTTSVVVVLKDIKESVKTISIPVKVSFHVKENKDLEEGQQDNILNGHVVNTSFIKLYDSNGTWINNMWTKENYIDDTNLNLAQKDIDIYGNYLDRERDNITFYNGEKNDYSAYTKIEANQNSFKTTLTIGASFRFVEEDYPNRFSLYTILPSGLTFDGYRIKEDLWDIMTISGLECTSKELADACTPEVIFNYKESGRIYIALHFNFGDKKINQNGTIKATFKTKVEKETIKLNSNIFVKSCVIIDDSIPEYSLGKVSDNGSWGDSKDLFDDIDGDGDKDETLHYGYSYESFIYADSSQFQLTKYVKTTYIDDWTQLPNVPYEEYSGNYQYKLSITNGNNISKNIVVVDLLESGENAQWKGILQSIDLSKCEQIGLKGTIYYSELENPGTLNSGNWSTEISENVKAVAVDFGEYELKEGKELPIILNMKAPSDTSLKDKVTENGFVTSFTMLDSTTENITVHDSLKSNFVQVKLIPPLKTIVVTKVDKEAGTSLEDAEFELINKNTGEVISVIRTNERGQAIFHDISPDNPYIVREITAPYGYELSSDTEVIIDKQNSKEKVIYVTVKNERKKGMIEIYKTNSFDNRIRVANAQYALYDSEGNKIATAITNENGVATFQNVVWGKYVIKEISSPIGYQLSEDVYITEVTRESVLSPIKVATTNIQDDTYVHFVKYEKTVGGEETNNAMEGVTFELVRVFDGNPEPRGLYVTDAEGRINLSNLPYGDYYFREYSIPLGYEVIEPVTFTLSPENKDITVVAYNKRSSGSIIVLKKDNLGNNVLNAQFTLYDETKSNSLGTYVTDEYGAIRITGLEWGTYYLLETKAPKGYQIDKEWKKVEIDAKNLEVMISCMNETLKGTIVITKTNEDGTTVLPNAQYNLYANDGTVIQENLVTNENGQIIVENLEWGSYYFKEIVPPVGYGLSDEVVRFSVNVLNAGCTQYLNVTDPLEAKKITLTKMIKADEINFYNGNPTFLFKVEGVDIHGKNHTYYRVVSFDEKYVIANTDKNGNVSQSVTVSSLVAGEYKATEEEHSRYYLDSISDITNGMEGEEEVTFELIENMDASATFLNLKYENQGFSDNQVTTNVLKRQVKMTALSVSYGAEQVKAKSKVDRNLLEVVALYDDGSAQIIEDGYTLSIEKFPDENGDYTVSVSYEENGIIRSGDFTVVISEANSAIVQLSVKLKKNITIPTESTISSNMFEVTATYSSGVQEILDSTDYIVSPYKAPELEGDFIATIKLNPNKFDKEGEQDVSARIRCKAVELEAKIYEYFRLRITSEITEVIFTDIKAPANATIIDVSEKNNGTVVAWKEEHIMYVSSQKEGKRIKAPDTCRNFFYESKNLKKIDLSNFDTVSVTSMYAMFAYCNSLEEVIFGEYFDTSRVVTMRVMFSYCENLKTINASDWNTSRVQNMEIMFLDCFSLELDCSSWNVGKVMSRSLFKEGAPGVIPPVWVN